MTSQTWKLQAAQSEQHQQRLDDDIMYRQSQLVQVASRKQRYIVKMVQLVIVNFSVVSPR